MRTFAVNHRRIRPRAFGMVESIFSIVLVSGVVVVALNTAGATFTSRRLAADRIRAQLLAGELMSEILAQEYEEPDTTVAFGLESGEGTGNREAFDDVDDYRNLVDAPPKLKGGSQLSGFSDWSRTAAVVRVNTTNPNNLALSESGMKKITVAVKYRGTTIASITALKSGAMRAAGKSSLLEETVEYVEKVNAPPSGSQLE